MQTPDPNTPPAKLDFRVWIEDPERIAAVEKFDRELSEGKSPQVPPFLAEIANQTLAMLLEQNGLRHAMEKIDAAMKKVPAPGTVSEWTRLALYQQALDEIMDVGLDFPEPTRSVLLRHFTALREEFKNARPDEQQ